MIENSRMNEQKAAGVSGMSKEDAQNPAHSGLAKGISGNGIKRIIKKTLPILNWKNSGFGSLKCM